MSTQAGKLDYSFVLQNDRITLTGKVEPVTCKQCNRTLALKNDKVIMSKTNITLVGTDGQILLRCGNCKAFNELKTGKIEV